MIFSRLFSWLENKKKFNYLKNQKNNELIFELKVEGITNEKILSAIKKVPRELFVEQHLIKEAYQKKLYNKSLENIARELEEKV